VGDRDRDETGRARSARPRDATGRPLEPGEAGVPRAPEGVPRTRAEALAQAEHYLLAQLPFQAHEVFEDQWKQCRDAGAPDAGRWQGLAQVCVGLTHLQRGNFIGAMALLRRGAENLEAFDEVWSAWAYDAALHVESGVEVPARPALPIR
jgi:hypothetical protein